MTYTGKVYPGRTDSEGENLPNSGPDANTVGLGTGYFGSHHGERGHGYTKGLKVRVAFDSEKHYGMDIPSSEVSMTEVNCETVKVAEEKCFPHPNTVYHVAYVFP